MRTLLERGAGRDEGAVVKTCFTCQGKLIGTPGPFCSIACSIQAIAHGVPGALYSGVFEEPHQLHPPFANMEEWEAAGAPNQVVPKGE